MDGVKKWIRPYIEVTRPPLNFMGVCLATSGAIIALRFTGKQIPIADSIIGAFAVFMTVGGMHTINDYFDRFRDREVWPNRPIPSGRLNPLHALALGLSLFAVGLSVVWITFNAVCFYILLTTVALGIAYSRYLRDKVGYLTLAPIIGLFPAGGYAAFAGERVFVSPVPWMLYFMVTLWQAGHILVYSPAHGVKETKTVVSAFLVALSPQATAVLGTIFFSVLLILSLWLYLVVSLSLAYLAVASISGCFVILLSLKLAVNPTIERSLLAFNAASLHAIILFSTIAVDVFIRFYLYDYFTILLGLFACALVGGSCVSIVRAIINIWKGARKRREVSGCLQLL